MRCRDCGHRFWHGLLFNFRLPYAHCPQCLRQDLSDWAEKYYMPGKFWRMLLYVGGKAHRCSACRVNFVSFFPRKAEYVNPAKLKRMAEMQQAGVGGRVGGRVGDDTAEFGERRGVADHQ
ncbi:MAG: hypothetical protein J0L64_24940 [Acidobacteria bacterium]|nr:hypothetical protein [Acidobacteriota bacterium]